MAMLVLLVFTELSRTSGFIDIPTVPLYDIAGMYGGGIMFSAPIYTTDPNDDDDQDVDPMDFDMFFRYGLGGRGEVSLSMFTLNTYVVSFSYLLAKEKENVPAFFAGIDDISYNTHLSTIGLKDSTGFIEEYNYATHCGGRPWELFSTYIGMQKTFGKYFDFVFGIGRGRFVGYGDRSHYFNTDLFVLGSDYKTSNHSWWAFGIFFGGSIKIPGGLELIAEIDGRDGNAGIKYHHKYFSASFALAKSEQLSWWNHPPYSPRLTFGLETNNRYMLEGPQVGSIECVVQDVTSKELLSNSIIDIKEINKRYRAVGGSFSMSLPAGNYTITATRPNYVDYIAKITVKPGVKSNFVFNLKKTEEAMKQQLALREKAIIIENALSQGKVKFSEGKLNEARTSFEYVVSLDPNNAEAKDYLAKIKTRRTELIAAYTTEAKDRTKAKDYKRAIEFWQKVLELDPENAEAKAGIADLQKLVQEPKKPKTTTKPPETKKATAEEINALYNKGVSYFTAEKYDEALKVFNQVLALDPNHKGAKDYKKRTEARLKALKGG